MSTGGSQGISVLLSLDIVLWVEAATELSLLFFFEEDLYREIKIVDFPVLEHTEH